MLQILRSSRASRAVLASVACVAFSGCVLDSPYWAQTFATTTTAIPIQAWVTNNATPVKIECSKAYHGGLYPFGGPEVWTLVTNITPSANASYDPTNGVIYSAGKMQVLPSACWNADHAYSPPLYMTALRATQGSTTAFYVFDGAGLECLGRENGKGKSWFSWLSYSCNLKYSGSSTALPYVRVIANASGSMATSSSSAVAEPARRVSSEVLKARRDSQPLVADLERRLGAEAVDASWASSMEATLRSAFDAAAPKGSMLIDANCRSTMCRAEVQHADDDARLRFIGALAPAGLFSNDGQRGLAQESRDASGNLRSTFFIAREGQRLAETGSR